MHLGVELHEIGARGPFWGVQDKARTVITQNTIERTMKGEEYYWLAKCAQSRFQCPGYAKSRECFEKLTTFVNKHEGSRSFWSAIKVLLNFTGDVANDQWIHIRTYKTKILTYAVPQDGNEIKEIPKLDTAVSWKFRGWIVAKKLMEADDTEDEEDAKTHERDQDEPQEVMKLFFLGRALQCLSQGKPFKREAGAPLWDNIAVSALCMMAMAGTRSEKQRHLLGALISARSDPEAHGTITNWFGSTSPALFSGTPGITAGGSCFKLGEWIVEKGGACLFATRSTTTDIQQTPLDKIALTHDTHWPNYFDMRQPKDNKIVIRGGTDNPFSMKLVKGLEIDTTSVAFFGFKPTTTDGC